VQRVRTSRPQQQAETRTRLLEAAQTVLSRMGYHGASLDLVSAEAGYSKGAVYSNFQNKEALFLELLRTHMDRDLGELERISSLEPKQLFDANTKWLEGLNAAPSDCPALIVELQLHARRSPEFAKSFYALQQKKHEALGKIITRYFEAAGEPLPMDAMELAHIVDAAINGISIQGAPSTAGQRSQVGMIVDRLMKLITHRL
jgi:AcrR family transcriptional regulator